LLFLNRRGYSPLTLCRSCGHRWQCKRCAAWLVTHKSQGRLRCHHCGHIEALPKSCPACGAADTLASSGPGVERLEEEIKSLLPQARTLVFSSDTLTTPKLMEAALEHAREGAVDVLIGTQLMAKGHHFPALRLVGVVDADMGLYGSDFRAAEKTHQLLHQVAGRAGRAGEPGHVLIQTTDPNHPVLHALSGGDDASLIDKLLAEREAHTLPPYGRLASLILSARDTRALENLGRHLAATAPNAPGIAVLGPAPAPMALLRGRHRARFLIKAARGAGLQAFLAAWLAHLPRSAASDVMVDVDPYSFM
jgi:primosomal protein N' (replication factor Y) (superfamily II helicase)